ncbi:MAG TPA: hypothetical protein VGO55_14525 [Allosphingosinicella sp.]|jgi:hypothetical protein|nr:hypothetical protein [Allosphingosinicella sp.]
MRLEAMAMLALLAGCAAPAATAGAPVEQVAADEAAGTVEVRLGGTARLGDVSVRPIAVIEDSRCPADVACVWAGRLRLRAAITRLGETELILGQPLALPGGGSLTLVAALPAPRHRPPPGAETGPATRFAFRRD